MRYDNKITFVEKPFLRIDHPMDEFVYELLLSDLTKSSIMAELKRIKSRTQLKVITLLTKNRNKNFITIFEEAMDKQKKASYRSTLQWIKTLVIQLFKKF